jgi:ATP-dependent RNA helicase RhlE
MNTIPDFSGLGLSEKMMEFLTRSHFRVPTPIQHRSIPVGLEGKDLVGVAQTGTGKTLAFGLPMIQRLATEVKGRGLVLLPTRELALQVNEVLLKIGAMHGIHTAVLIGGESMNRQFDQLRRRPRVIIATPGRLIDHMERGTAKLGDVKILVLDEADRMLDMGFAPQINQILRNVPRERQTLLYSATMPHAIMSIASSYMKMPVRVEVAPSGTAAEKVEQEIILIYKEEKQRLLEAVLKEHLGPALIFTRTKRGATKVCRNLIKSGFKSAEIHSDKSLNQRREALEGFKRGRYRILVATDIAARGIDVKDIQVVINYDLPDDSNDYIHRIGRTARAGKEGKAISFATPDQRKDIRDIEALIRQELKVTSKIPGISATPPKPFAPRRGMMRVGSRRLR